MTQIIYNTNRGLCTLLFLCFLCYNVNSQVLKSIVYDFDGLDIGATDLPEGDFQSGGMQASIAAVPLGPKTVLGDRCMQLKVSGPYSTFGRGIARYVEFDPAADQFNFFFYNPSTNSQNAQFDVQISEDDNQSNAFEAANDDVWIKTFNIAPSGNWQLYQVPLKSFTDANTGGNGAMDMAFTNNQGMVLSVEFRFGNVGTAQTFYLDLVCFTEGGFPSGSSEFELPAKAGGDYALLGAYSQEDKDQYHLTASKFEALFSPGKKIRYVNTFIHWAYGTSTTPSEMPGASAQTLLNNGYIPVLTWEPIYAGYDRLDPVQPRLQNIINGEFDTYITDFAHEVAKLSDTIIIRFMHEFEGDWYPWSICKNGNDPQKYISAYRHVVDKFRAAGAGNVKWMWCVNSDYTPYESFNWIVKAYPGAQYVNIVATDIYNNHYPLPIPWWRSFRWQTTESYYYLAKYFPDKPLFICEVGCRERFSEENTNSQSKGDWYAEMDRLMQSNFHKARALIFFNSNPDQNWFVNSSPGALASLQQNVWEDDYYFKESRTPVTSKPSEETNDMYIFPNPAREEIRAGLISSTDMSSFEMKVTDGLGQVILVLSEQYEGRSYKATVDTGKWPRGIYYIQMSATGKDDGKKRNVRKKVSVL